MNEHIHKGWIGAILSILTSAGTFLTQHGIQTLLATVSLCAGIWAIRASSAAYDASIEQKRLAKQQADILTCDDCIQNGITPLECPHYAPNFPLGCGRGKMLSHKIKPKKL